MLLQAITYSALVPRGLASRQGEDLLSVGFELAFIDNAWFRLVMQDGYVVSQL
ncbi:hypothetical protein BDA96_04G369400 [Sorghum bicolor]|jgi:hypothetical protein|uniref:Uncharacterized protein n=1 Tax=Sorghum bicolor TaxID=4558 RepID=A0A921RA34_SORBI|nr:hypothetical protein BDA96_04G369400 [Sorghum bicolor]